MKSNQKLRVIAAAGLALLIAVPAAAQDTHYWFDQFGNRALLLSGAVVGEPADLSAVYYNPGGLALAEQTELLLAGLVLSVNGVQLIDAVADGGDLSQSRFDVAPSLLAGEIPLSESRHRFAYSVMKRYGSSFLATGQADIEGIAFGLPVVELLGNSLRVDSKLSEYWGGATWSYPIRPDLGIGVTTFVAVRNQRRYATNNVQILTTGDRAAVGGMSTDYDYHHWRALWKIGAQGRFRDWNVGLTVTTPSVGLFGTGDLRNDLTIVSQLDTPEGPLTVIANDAQLGVPADYRSPLSIAVGAGRAFGPTTLHVTAEYFAPLDAYTVIDGQPFVGQTGDGPFDTAIVEQLDSVLNVAVGVERRFREDLLAYFGFHTDFNAASDEPLANLSNTKWDFYHFSGGATVSATGRSFTLGGELALASDTIAVSTGDPFEPLGAPAATQASAYKLTILLGFSFLAGGD